MGKSSEFDRSDWTDEELERFPAEEDARLFLPQADPQNTRLALVPALFGRRSIPLR